MNDFETALRNLQARIFRDGGQRTEELGGPLQAMEAADAEVVRLHIKAGENTPSWYSKWANADDHRKKLETRLTEVEAEIEEKTQIIAECRALALIAADKLEDVHSGEGDFETECWEVAQKIRKALEE